ncbi:MAG: carbohydrate binding family 9 domain-containing protein [bacterium]|nr:carbohydrate binding family 9 domain-containing protein [bacterium]MCP5068306.1 carbohydrate binding family 9 domain-containing protein [bacterium]
MRSGLRWLALGWLLATSAALAETPSAELSALPEEVPPPTIDGVLEDEAWDHAVLLSPLVQVVPVEGGPPSERTEVRITYDRNALYIAVQAFDRAPDQIIASGMRRDTSLRPDDRISVMIDTFHDHRNAFLFSTNPNGSRYDGIVEDNYSFKAEWDGIWYTKSRIHEDGWSSEFAIPFKSLSFDPAGTTWGFNLLRTVRRHNEENRWASAKQNKSMVDVSEAGDLTGLRGLEQGLGLDIKPAGSIGWTHDRTSDRSFSNLDPSLDVFYRVTPSITAALTTNTDFSDAAVDSRQVNLSRFALFFPETRDFFLQDAGIFDFPVGGTGATNGIPFFSRRIGLSGGGDVIPIRIGTKITGRTGPLNFGALNVQMAGHGDVDAKNLSVGRAKLNIGEESFVGLIATHGDPLTNGSNSLISGDLNLRTSKIFGNQILEFRSWLQHSTTSGPVGDDTAWSARLAYPNDLWNWALDIKQVGEDFNPALGFVNRPETRQSIASLRRRWRPAGSAVRIYEASAFGIVTTDLGNDLESLYVSSNGRIENHAGDFIKLEGNIQTEVLETAFEILPGIVVPKDRYDFSRVTLSGGTATSRPLAAELSFGAGTFYSGHIRAGRALLEWRASKHFFASLEFLQNSVRLHEGNFTTRLGRVNINVVFTPDLSWETFMQFDNLSNSLGWNSRLRWILRPGEEIVFVWNQAFDTTNYDLRGERTNLIGKVSWTFRF